MVVPALALRGSIPAAAMPPSAAVPCMKRRRDIGAKLRTRINPEVLMERSPCWPGPFPGHSRVRPGPLSTGPVARRPVPPQWRLNPAPSASTLGLLILGMRAMDDTVTLRRGRLQVDLAPACGAITRFTVGEGAQAVNLFRPAPDPLPATLAPLATSCFPLVPFSGRIAAARLRFGDQSYELPASPTGEANALHGEGWIAPWRVAGRSDDRVELAFRGGGGGRPFPYAAGPAFRLTAASLFVAVS